MTVVSVTDFRQHLAEWLDRVRAGEEIAVSERGVVVARVLPSRDSKEEARQYFAELRRKGATVGDVTSPIDTGWDAVNE